ncbi:hypothetical protein BKA69DRAFT_1028718 [Paraphysoderma sedebokerense]|nr:hypothetical protein BKA69DRAFT_1028718 [Paraphysoderma sedebokerense]
MPVIHESADNTPFPTGNYVDAVKSSCYSLFQHCRSDSINQAAIDSLVSAMDESKLNDLKEQAELRMPLKFDSIEAEVNLLSLRALLSFGTGFRQELHSAVGRGAFDTITFGAISLHITSPNLTAKALTDLSLSEISSLFNLPLHDEKQHESLPITVSSPHTLQALAKKIQIVLKDTGDILTSMGCQSLGQFVLRCCKKDGEVTAAAEVLETLVRTFPAFRDMYVLSLPATSNTPSRRIPLYIFQKAQLLLITLHRHFLLNSSSPFNFSDINSLTVLPSPSIIAVLTAHEVLNIPEDIRIKISSKTELTTDESAIVRGLCVVAGEEIKKRVHQDERRWVSGLKNWEVDSYLWGLRKDGRVKEFEKAILKGTAMF